MTDQRRIYQEVFTVADASIDVQGHVNNREYLRWMEGVATRHAALLGWDFETLKVRNRSWVAREHWIEYLQRSRHGSRVCEVRQAFVGM